MTQSMLQEITWHDGESRQLFKNALESGPQPLKGGPCLHSSGPLLAFCQPPSRPGHRVALLVQELLDLQDHGHIPFSVEPLSTPALAGLQGGKLALPVPQDVGWNPRDGRDLADAEVEAVRDLRWKLRCNWGQPLPRGSAPRDGVCLNPRRSRHFPASRWRR